MVVRILDAAIQSAKSKSGYPALLSLKHLFQCFRFVSMVSKTSLLRPSIINLYMVWAKPSIWENSILGGIANAFGSVMMLTKAGPSALTLSAKVGNTSSGLITL